MKNKIDGIFSFCYFFGLIILAFVAGAIVINYSLPSSRGLRNAFIAFDAYRERFFQSDREKEVAEEERNDLTDHGENFIQHPKVTWNKKLAYNGYTLVTTGYLPYPYLVDMEGRIVYRWQVPMENLWTNASSCHEVLNIGVYFVNRAQVFPNGDIIAQYSDWGAPYGCGMMRVDKNAHVVWKYENLVHHDFTLDDKGNTYTLMQETLTDPLPGTEDLPYPLKVDYIAKLDSKGNETQRISLLEAFLGTSYELMLMHRERGNGDEVHDYFHTNSIDVLKPEIAGKFPQFKPGDLLVSFRSLGVLAVVNPASQKIVWAYRGFFRYQHAASFLPNGHILVLDNQGHIDTSGKFSRLLELNPATLGVEWSFTGSAQHPFSIEKAGDAQRLPNGNTLVAESVHGRIFEITPDGQVVWDYRLPQKKQENMYNQAIFTAERLSEEDLPFLKTVTKETDGKAEEAAK